MTLRLSVLRFASSAEVPAADSRRFYEFLKSMETLEQTASSETTILLSTEGELFRFLKGGGR